MLLRTRVPLDGLENSTHRLTTKRRRSNLTQFEATTKQVRDPFWRPPRGGGAPAALALPAAPMRLWAAAWLRFGAGAGATRLEACLAVVTRLSYRRLDAP